MTDELLRLEGLSKYYTSSQSVVMGLNNISLTFHRGEFVAITGESGSGKSTLAHVMGGILPYESGELFLEGKPTSHYDSTDWERYRRDHVSFISQNYGILAGCSVLENVISALRFSGMSKDSARQKAENILKEVELWDLRTRRASKLSSGQKQRLSIARALAKPASILIADEPTGNLDPENSAKVIDLLARAARERLVILITHEFSEAENHATRHISVQDGQIVMDAPLRPFPETAILSAPIHEKKPQRLSPYVSRLQLSGRPVWSALVLLFFVLTAFAVFAFLGTFVVSVDDTNTRMYDNSAFQNGSMQRIVVIRGDQAPLSENDFSAILSAEHVVAIEPYGYVADVNYAYREGVDYEYKYSSQSSGSIHDTDRFIHTSLKILNGTPFMQTIPLLSDDREFLTAGRLPQNAYEVVMAGDPSLIGTTMPVFLQDQKNWSSSCKIELHVDVVGVTDYGSGLFFHEDIGRSFNDYFAFRDRESLFLYAQDLADDQIRLSDNYYTRFLKYELYSMPLQDQTIPEAEYDKNNPDHRISLKLICEENENMADGFSPTHTSFFNGYYEVSQNTFERILYQNPCDQASITILDYAYTDRVLEQLRDMGYIALSPFREGSTKVNAQLAEERMQTLTVCAIALVLIILLQIIVLRALFGTQTESYRLLSNIGLVCPVAKRSLYWQVLLFTILGQLVGLAALLLCNALQVERIVRMMRYLPPTHLLAFGAVHLAAALIAAFWISHSISKQVFPLAGRQSDLSLDTEEVAA